MQRTGFVPANANDHHEGGPALGSARITIQSLVTGGKPPTEGWQARAIPIQHSYGKGVAWTSVTPVITGDRVETVLEVPAGGWYRLELKTGADGLTAASVEPVGVGDIFLIAGQSYAGNTGDEVLSVDDRDGRISAYDLRNNRWAVANDPFPPPVGGNGGTPWPAAMNLLLPMARVPIGLVNVSVGGTAVGQWLPGEVLVAGDIKYYLYKDLVAAGKAMGRFRAVLWQQGESDVIAKTSAEVYQRRLNTVVDQSAGEWGFRPLWMLAKSTCHPTVYVRPVEEGVIRGALEQLSHKPGFAPGPDTDVLCEVGLYRAPMGTRRHFTGAGQRAAGLLWFTTLWNVLYTPTP